MLRGILRKFGHSWDAAQRFVQNVGLERAAALARRALGESPAPSPTTMADWQRRTLGDLLERMCHDPHGRLPAPRECGAVEATARFISKMPTPRQAQLRQLLTLFEAGPKLLSSAGERARFCELSDRAKDAYIAGWAESPIAQRRAVFQGLKSVCMMGYWSRSQAWEEIGFRLEGNPGVPAHLTSEREDNR